jgi:hypothetical protein
MLRISFLAVFIPLLAAIAGQDDTANAQDGFFPGRLFESSLGRAQGEVTIIGHGFSPGI